MAANPPQPSLKLHALVVPAPAQGHINPMLHFSMKLAASGVTITFVNTQCQTKSQILLPAGEALDIRLVGIPDGLCREENVANDIPKLCETLIKMEDSLVELVEKLVPPVTCIIADVFVMSTQNVARKFGIPHVGFWVESAANYAAFTEGYCPLKENPGEVRNFISCVPGSPLLRFKEAVPSFLQPCDCSDYVFWYITQCFQRIHESAFVLLNTYDDLEESSSKFIRKQNMCTIGPLQPSEFRTTQNVKHKNGTPLWPEDHGCIEWLDKQDPSSVLYISFGSWAVLSAQQIEEIARGLEASQFPILMVIRPTLVYGESAVFPEGLVDRMKDRSIFVERAPQLHVLSHPAVGGFLTHCGWNSTLESISRGLPMLCLPYFGDQAMNCRCVVDRWRVGLEFEADKNGLVSRMEVEKKVRVLMDSKESKEMRERAAKLRDAANTAVVEGGSSHTNLELFMNFLT